MKNQRTESYSEAALTTKEEGQHWKVHNSEHEVATQAGSQIRKNKAGRG